ncbi:biogenesis of lysosome-related organelles complex 1 subunit 2 [Holotrichia oblita]|uniref:Biogenesis of lysosome-related organelles complex 1 subunit 2 n=1 Tax=Holotrichia oblita TaxID=644536 RepID=A0ACB9TG53_HOLOL|nr:biogenesis of lysosome-related organelles complex 1 subunit 2 [Holotrichia oblita]
MATNTEDNQSERPTLSTSTSSFEALDPHDPNLSRLATTMFNKTADYLYGELTATLEDYRLLENMNNATITKYSDMKHIANGTLQPYLDQIDQIEDSVIKLEQAAYKLDAYSKRLEAKFKNLEKR